MGSTTVDIINWKQSTTTLSKRKVQGHGPTYNLLSKEKTSTTEPTESTTVTSTSLKISESPLQPDWEPSINDHLYRVKTRQHDGVVNIIKLHL